MLLFYKFLTSQVIYKKNTKIKSNLGLNSNLSNTFLNMLFFQYWSSFFSSIILIYFIINILYFYGAAEWLIINYLISLDFANNINTILLAFIFILVVFSFTIKLGFTPIQLYKIEVYKGLSFVSIFFYTTFYFLVFFLLFLIIFIINLNFISSYLWYVYIIFISIGSLYTLFLLFDINYLKAFFAYSTVVNSLSFVVASMSYII